MYVDIEWVKAKFPNDTKDVVAPAPRLSWTARDFGSSLPSD